MKYFLTIWILLTSILMSGQSKYEKDFDEFWNEVNNHYAYFDQQKIDWNRVKEIYQTQVRKIATDNDFIRFMEKVMHEFHNGHISLNKI